jgi:uncharacterized membrane protein
MKLPLLLFLLRAAAVLLILRVLVTIVANYPDYFPPDFNSLFLQGRELTFHGLYRVAFYVHIFAGPMVLLGGLVLLSDYVRRRWPGLHRHLGRVQVMVLLLLLLPTSLVMSTQAFGGWWAGLSFALLSVMTAGCAVIGVVYARRRLFQQHRRWMLRCVVLLCSAVILRLVSGAAGVLGVESPELAYILAAWSSWLLPLGCLEFVVCWKGGGRPRHT